MQISKKNEVYLQIENLSSSESAELSDFFTFEVPGFKFMPAYRNRVWDGKIRLFSPASGEIYVGLLPYVRQWCSDNGVQYEISKEVEGKSVTIRKLGLEKQETLSLDKAIKQISKKNKFPIN